MRQSKKCIIVLIAVAKFVFLCIVVFFGHEMMEGVDIKKCCEMDLISRHPYEHHRLMQRKI